MSAALTAILLLIQQALPLLTSSSQSVTLITSIIKALETWLPIIVAEIKDLYPIVKNIIQTLQSGGAVLTEEQKATLVLLDNAADAAFETSIKGLDPNVV